MTERIRSVGEYYNLATQSVRPLKNKKNNKYKNMKSRKWKKDREQLKLELQVAENDLKTSSDIKVRRRAVNKIKAIQDKLKK